MKRLLYIILALILLNSCNNSQTSRGAITFKTTNDSVKIVQDKICVIVDAMDHKTIKDTVIDMVLEQYPAFNVDEFYNSKIVYSNYQSFGRNKGDGSVIVSVTFLSDPDQAEASFKAIGYYEDIIISELKKSGYRPKDRR